MNTFVAEVADYLLRTHPGQLGACKVVFPNRRAGLFLKKALSKKIDRPAWSPDVFSLEDFLFKYSSIRKADTLTLIFKLYESFTRFHQSGEGFESFYFWGEMLLRDFEEVDHYLVNPTQLFKHIEDDRQIAEDFYFLDPEQEKIIQKFWQDFFPRASKSQEQFVETWRILAPVYEDFKQQLFQEEIGYTSHVYRTLLDELDDKDIEGPIIFAGFNALTPVEEQLIKWFVHHHDAKVLWDIDTYYLDDLHQEAGLFIRNYQQDSVLGATFAYKIPSSIASTRSVDATGVSLEVGQAKLVGQQIQELLQSGTAKPEEIVVVLPQDYMLFAVLNAMPPEASKLNVTMGYPLKETPLFGLLEAVLEAQENSNLTPEQWLSFYHKPVLDILSHPYLYEPNKKQLDELIHYIKTNNQIRVLQQDILVVGSPLLNGIFREIKSNESFAAYLLDVVRLLSEEVVERFGLEKEFLYQFRLMLSKLDEILSSQLVQVDLKTFKGLFRKTARSVKIPFSGEPVEGLQIMGVLETRNLDFKHVFMLNMNEDIFPASQRNGSFIPYRIRKAFELPTFEIQDAIYAYLFYRLFHRGEFMHFYYNMYADFGLSGEVSRFLRQLELESGIDIQHHKLSNTIQVREHTPISIEKTPDIMQKLELYTDKGRSKLSPSAINTYLDCSLRFYFKYVLRLFTNDELNDELSPRDFGNILHKVMEYLYEDATRNKERRIVEPNDFFLLKSSVDGAIEKSFRDHFRLKDKQRFVVKGRNVVMVEIMKRFVNQTLARDEAHAPFEILSLENDKDGNYDMTLPVATDGKVYQVRLKGIIDRVDRKAGKVRVIDYKSGRDTTEIESVEKVFDRTPTSDFKKGRNKAGFQTLYYAWLYASKRGEEEPIVPGILNIQELFTADFDERLKLKGKPLVDARPYLHDFKTRFEQLLTEIYGMDHSFNQTDDLKKCTFCDFTTICGR